MLEAREMSLSILDVRAADPEDWDEIWRGCGHSTYFHSREWAEIWNAYTKGAMRPEPRSIEFSDGKRAIIPLSVKSGGWGLQKQYVSSPAWTFGGWLCTDDLEAAHASLLGRYMTERLGNLFWRLNPYDGLSLAALDAPAREDFTQVMDLSGGFDAAYGRWSRGKRRAVRKAIDNGISVRPASTLDEWRAYYAVYEDSLRRWGGKATSSYGWALFEEMHRRASPNIRLWLAFYGEKVIAGDLLFYAGRHVVDWHAAALEEYFHLKPAGLVIYEALRDACERDCLWFDLNPSGGHEGTRAFKEELGAEAMRSPVVVVEGRGILDDLRG
jgi:hypothetical protein